MPQVIVKPEDVWRFASELRRFNEELKNNFTRTHGIFKQLGETWRDQEHRKFEGEFDQTARAIRQFLAASEKYVPFLVRKADAADEFLRRR